MRHFINKPKKDGQFSKANIKETKIIDWLSKLDNEDGNIHNLLKQRDKLYAHEDGEKIKNILSLNKINEILKIGKEIVREINIAAFERGIDFSPIPSPIGNLKYLIEKLAKCKKGNYSD